MLELLKDHYRRGIGIDASREMLAVARAKLAAAGIANAQVRLGEIADLDAGTGRADLVVIHQVLHYFDDPGRALAAGEPRCSSQAAALLSSISRRTISNSCAPSTRIAGSACRKHRCRPGPARPGSWSSAAPIFRRVAAARD